MLRPALARLALALVGLSALSCSSNGPTDNTSSVSIAVTPAELTLEQGAEGTVTVELERTDVSGPVSLTVTGVPNEVAAVIDPPQLSGPTLTATATMTATESATPGTYTLTVRASAASVEDAMATFTLEVVEAPDEPLEDPIWVVLTFGMLEESSAARDPNFFYRIMGLKVELNPSENPYFWKQADLSTPQVGTGAAGSGAGGPGGAGPSPTGQAGQSGARLALFTGGYANDVVNTATVYDFSAGASQDLTMTTARTQHTQTRLDDGRALIVGGFGPTAVGAGVTTTWDTAELFDPEALAFAATGSMDEPRGNHSAALLSDGRVLIAGGEFGFTVHRSSEIYDPAAGTFTPGADMVVARTLHSATTLPDGRVLIAGGQGAANERLASAEVFDTQSGQFTGVGFMSEGHGNGHTATLLSDGRVLIVGGWRQLVTPTAAADLFDPATNTFTTVGPMSIPRFGHEAALLPDGRVMVVGGQSDEGDVLSSSEIFDPATGVFTAGPEATGLVFDLASVVLDP